MSKQVQNFIDDARRFQRCSDHDLAISSLQLAQQEDHHKEHEIEIQKLFSLSYRKIGNYNMALLHINNAINQNDCKHCRKLQRSIRGMEEKYT